MRRSFVTLFVISSLINTSCAYEEEEEEEEFCQSSKDDECSSNKKSKLTSTPCDRVIDLIPVEDSWTDRSKIFFVESSDRPYLDARQTCSVESAARVIGGPPAVVVLTSRTLDLSAKNETCQLYSLYAEKSVFFRRVDKAEIFKGTPLQSVYESGRLDQSPTPIVHYSDAIRLVLIHRYGGWYSDLDMIFLKSVSDLTNVISGDDATDSERQTNSRFVGPHVSNAIFHLDKGHPLVEGALELFPSFFDGKWASGGPVLVTAVLRKLCKIDQKTPISTDVFTPERCAGIRVLEPKSFFPVGWFDAGALLQPGMDEKWEELFKDSFAVHFFHSSRAHKVKMMKPKNYGKDLPGLLYLAVRHCPVSFNSVKLF